MCCTNFITLLLLLAFSITPYQEKTDVSDLKWNESVKKEIDEAVNLASKDPVISFLKFKEILESKENSPDLKQKAWLEKQIVSLQAQALEALQRDYNAAAEALDIRGMFIVKGIASKIARDGIKAVPTIDDVNKKIFSEPAGASYTWNIVDAAGQLSEKTYSEAGSTYSVELSPSQGSQLLRVKIRIENISSESDKPYAQWAMEDNELWATDAGKTLRTFASPKQTSAPYRWLNVNWIWVLVDNKFIQRSYIRGQPCHQISLRIKDETNKVKDVHPPCLLTKGGSIDLEVFFQVPKESQKYWLFTYGATPTSIRITP